MKGNNYIKKKKKQEWEAINDNIGDLVPPVSVFWYRQFTLSDFSYRLSGTALDAVH